MTQTPLTSLRLPVRFPCWSYNKPTAQEQNFCFLLISFFYELFFCVFNELAHPGPLTGVLELKAQVNYFMKANFLCGSIKRFIQYGNEKWEWTERGLVVPLKRGGSKRCRSGCQATGVVFACCALTRVATRRATPSSEISTDPVQSSAGVPNDLRWMAR